MLPNIKQMGTPEFRQGWRRLPAELKHKILEHFVNAILPACNRSMCVMRKEHLRSATLYEIEGHSGPIERISAHPRFTAKKATLEFNMFQKTRYEEFCSVREFVRLYHDDVHILAKEVREATKRTLAKKDRLEQQKPEEGKPSIKVTVARWAVEEANTPCKLEWLRELRNLTRGPDEKEERLEGSFDWVDGRRV